MESVNGAIIKGSDKLSENDELREYELSGSDSTQN